MQADKAFRERFPALHKFWTAERDARFTVVEEDEYSQLRIALRADWDVGTAGERFVDDEGKSDGDQDIDSRCLRVVWKDAVVAEASAAQARDGDRATLDNGFVQGKIKVSGRHDPRTPAAFRQEWKDRGWDLSTAEGEHAPKTSSSDCPQPKQRHRQGAGEVSEKRAALVHEGAQRMIVIEESNGKPRRELVSIQTEDLVSLALRNMIKMDMLTASPVRPF